MKRFSQSILISLMLLSFCSINNLHAEYTGETHGIRGAIEIGETHGIRGAIEIGATHGIRGVNDLTGVQGRGGAKGTVEAFGARGVQQSQDGAIQSVGGSNEPKTIMFVHGAWGGGWDYRTMETLLEHEGYAVFRPTLTGLGEREHLNGPDVNLDTHIQDIVNVLTFEELTNVILVGHSYGGMVITGVAHRIPERIKHLVYLDAILPNDGESVFGLGDAGSNAFLEELANSEGDGWKIPPYWPEKGRDVPHPIETFRQPIALGNPVAEAIPSTYILTIEQGAEVDGFSRYAERAKERGWAYHELRTGHNAQRTMPNELAAILMSID